MLWARGRERNRSNRGDRGGPGRNLAQKMVPSPPFLPNLKGRPFAKPHPGPGPFGTFMMWPLTGGPQGTPGSGLAIDPLKTREVPQHLRLWGHMGTASSGLSLVPIPISFILVGQERRAPGPPHTARRLHLQSETVIKARWHFPVAGMSWPFHVLQTRGHHLEVRC